MGFEIDTSSFRSTSLSSRRARSWLKRWLDEVPGFDQAATTTISQEEANRMPSELTQEAREEFGEKISGEEDEIHVAYLIEKGKIPANYGPKLINHLKLARLRNKRKVYDSALVSESSSKFRNTGGYSNPWPLSFMYMNQEGKLSPSSQKIVLTVSRP